MTLKALPEIRAVQVGIAEFQSRQPHGTGTASGRRGYVGASGQGGDSRRPRPALGTRDRGEHAGTPGDCAEETGPSQPAARAGLPWRADASGLSLPLRGGGHRHQGWADARIRSGCCHRGASSLRAPRRRRLRAAAGAGKFSGGAQTLPAAPLSCSLDSVLCCEPEAPSRHSGRAGETLPLCGRRLRELANRTWARRPSSCLRASTPRHPAPSPVYPPAATHWPALRSQAPRCSGPIALLLSRRASTLSPPGPLASCNPQ